MRVGACVRVHHCGDDGGQPMQPVAMRADRGAAGTELGAEGPVLVSVLVAGRGPRLRPRATARQARFFAVLSSVRISLVRPAACAAFGKIIVPCAMKGGTPSGWVLAGETLRQAQGEGITQTLMLSLSKHAPWTACARLRQNAGRGSGRKSKRVHGAHCTPAWRVPDKSGEGQRSA